MHPTDLTINDYVDDALGRDERADVERHLAGCDSCRQLADDLRDVRRGAGALEPMAPPARAWKRIERELGSARPQPSSAGPAGAWRYASWRWLAAAAVLVLCTMVGVRYELAKRQSGAEVAAGGSGSSDNQEIAQSVESELLQAEQHYQKAITGLEQIANAEKGALDPQTAATLQTNLSVIDQAINESRAALKAQPASEPAQQSLLESFKTKIALLQDTVALINEMRKGNDAGAARIVSGLRQKS
jgi:anti-sigma factor RsiW